MVLMDPRSRVKRPGYVIVARVWMDRCTSVIISLLVNLDAFEPRARLLSRQAARPRCTRMMGICVLLESEGNFGTGSGKGGGPTFSPSAPQPPRSAAYQPFQPGRTPVLSPNYDFLCPQKRGYWSLSSFIHPRNAGVPVSIPSLLSSRRGLA
jgi:hypothetical protein